MKVLFVTGNHVRHFYLVNKFTNFFKKFILVSEKRNITNNHYSLLNKKVYKNHINDFFYKEKKILNLNIKKFEKKIVIKFIISKEIKRQVSNSIFSY